MTENVWKNIQIKTIFLQVPGGLNFLMSNNYINRKLPTKKNQNSTAAVKKSKLIKGLKNIVVPMFA